MPTRVFVHVLQARSLPVMDRASGLCDAYVKPQLKGVVFEPAQTQIAKKTLNPIWNQDLRCDVSDDCLLQDEPLQLRVFDYDAFSADDQIGTVYVHCNSLYEDMDDEGQGGTDRGKIEEERDARQLHGWFPIYDTMRGLCGELQVTVYIQHIMDFNPVEDSSIGVQVMCSSAVPDGYVIGELLGLVDELLVEPDPEHNWQDNFRSSRSSNEARQLLLLTMDGKLRRQIGRKVTDLGGNALLAYTTNLDFEDDFIIARGHGTAARVLPMLDEDGGRRGSISNPQGGSIDLDDKLGLAPFMSLSSQVAKGFVPKSVSSNLSSVMSSTLAITPLAQSSPKTAGREAAEQGGTSPSPPGATWNHAQEQEDEEEVPVQRELSAVPQNQLRTLHRTNRDDLRANLRITEVQLLSLQSVPAGVLSSVGGMVAARSVKVIGQESKEERVAGDRDAWWSEIREDIRAHARALDCSHVLGYTETTSIHEDVCVLSGAGTACVLDMASAGGPSNAPTSLPTSRLRRCCACHIPYSHRSPPFSMRLVLCELCGKKYVPDLILASIEIPPHIVIQGQGQLLEVHVCRSKSTDKKKQDTELSAGRVSELMPFLEFDLHKQILCKLKLRAHNAVWGLKTQLSINEDSVVCIATGTSVLLGALPLPQPLAIAKLEPVLLSSDAPDPLAPTPLLAELLRLSEANRQEALRHREDAACEGGVDDDDSSSQSSNSSSDDENGQTSAYILEIDHQQELEDLVGLLQEPLQPMALDVTACTTERMPWGPPGSGLPDADNCQLLTCFKRIAVPGGGRLLAATLWTLMQEMLGAMAFRLRNSGPALLCGVSTHLELPDDNTLQLGLVAMALTHSDAQQREYIPASPGRIRPPEGTDSFVVESSSAPMFKSPESSRGQPRSQLVQLTGLGYVPGRKVVRHMDRVLVCMIREVLKANEEGNLSSWTSRLLLEAQALCRAQAKSLGADAVVHYSVQHLKIYNLTHKMRVYTLLIVSGDAVRLADS